MIDPALHQGGDIQRDVLSGKRCGEAVGGRADQGKRGIGDTRLGPGRVYRGHAHSSTRVDTVDEQRQCGMRDLAGHGARWQRTQIKVK